MSSMPDTTIICASLWHMPRDLTTLIWHALRDLLLCSRAQCRSTLNVVPFGGKVDIAHISVQNTYEGVVVWVLAVVKRQTCI
jgi:hypothetical protein